MRREDAISIIDDLANVVITQIPDEITVFGRKYQIKKDITEGNREKALVKYVDLYEEVREKIRSMDEVPEGLVEAALVLKRAIMFLREYHGEDDVEDEKRWIEYVKRVGL